MNKWKMKLAYKPDFDQAMERVDAWYQGKIIDRVPIKFGVHNEEYDTAHEDANGKMHPKESRWSSMEDYWFDVAYHVERAIASFETQPFLAETFPAYCPNLGPNVYASFFDCPIEFGGNTSWAHPMIEDYDQLDAVRFDWNHRYFKQMEKMTEYALSKCKGKFLVGYTDFHPGIDCAAALRDNQELCMDFYDDPEGVEKLLALSSANFQAVYDHFDAMLKKHNQPSIAWMGIPSFGKMHIPSSDFGALISPAIYNEYVLPIIQQEVRGMDHNIFHLDGKGVAMHLDSLLKIPEINAIQWVQGVAEDQPIMQWLPLIRKIQQAGKGVVLNLEVDELDEFIRNMDKTGLYLCINEHDEARQKEIVRQVECWG